MTIRNWIKFFIKALLIGGIVTGVFGLFIRWDDAFAPFFEQRQWGEFFAAFIWMVIVGFTMSVVSQMGFFAYLTVHQFGVGIFRTLRLWNWVQLLITAIVIFDLIFFRFASSAETAEQRLLYMGLLFVLVASGLVVAYVKSKWTKGSAFISALFFMIVVTTLEWLPALMVNTENIDSWITLLLFPLLAVNAFQLLMLPKYNEQSEIDRQKLEQRRAARKAEGKPAAKVKKQR